MVTSKYRVVFDGCNHTAIRTEQELHEKDVIEERLNPVSGVHEKYYVCPGCAGDPKTGKSAPGFCHNTVLHRIAMAQRVWERE